MFEELLATASSMRGKSEVEIEKALREIVENKKEKMEVEVKSGKIEVTI